MKTLTALITGANKSIGFEVARILAGAGYHVFLGSRDKDKGEKAVERLIAEGAVAVAGGASGGGVGGMVVGGGGVGAGAGANGVRVEPVVIDVSSEDSVRDAAMTLSQRIGGLDVLINNAGIPGKQSQSPTTAADDNLHAVFETNFFGPIRVVRHFIGLLEKSERPRIVNVTSGLASLTLHSDPQWPYYNFKSAAYGPSKTALNAYTVALAYELRDKPFKVNAVDPGYTATEFNNFRGTKPVGEAAALVAQYAMLDENGPTGKFISDYGEMPW